MSHVHEEHKRKHCSLTGILEHHLPLGSFQNILLNRVLTDKAINADVGLLPYSMGPRHGLEIVLGIPITLQQQQKKGKTQIEK